MLEITQLTYTAIIGFLIVVILGPIFIPMLTKFKFGQTVRDDGPQTHFTKKWNTNYGWSNNDNSNSYYRTYKSKN